ncbi:hypothetical protein F5Y17DRAFT_415050 [Xylariaceae sp. FL0594]|nr:hypothetical protein F5Y17DRAFT_415050 [Xylariaceae sp. FL0594]
MFWTDNASCLRKKGLRDDRLFPHRPWCPDPDNPVRYVKTHACSDTYAFLACCNSVMEAMNSLEQYDSVLEKLRLSIKEPRHFRACSNAKSSVLIRPTSIDRASWLIGDHTVFICPPLRRVRAERYNHPLSTPGNHLMGTTNLCHFTRLYQDASHTIHCDSAPEHVTLEEFVKTAPGPEVLRSRRCFTTIATSSSRARYLPSQTAAAIWWNLL